MLDLSWTNSLLIHIYVSTLNDIAMKRVGIKCMKTLEIHCKTNIVEVFGKTEKLAQNSAMVER
jgi:hypothetical protein